MQKSCCMERMDRAAAVFALLSLSHSSNYHRGHSKGLSLPTQSPVRTMAAQPELLNLHFLNNETVEESPEWNLADILDLIGAWENHPELYDVSNQFYGNKEKAEEAVRHIAENLAKPRRELEIQRILKSLKLLWLEGHGKGQEDLKDNGASSCTNQFFKLLGFLERGHQTPATPPCDSPPATEDAAEADCEANIPALQDNPPEQPLLKRPRREETPPPLEQPRLEEISPPLEQPRLEEIPPPLEDIEGEFGQQVASELRKLTELQRQNAKLRIQQILFNASLDGREVLNAEEKKMVEEISEIVAINIKRSRDLKKSDLANMWSKIYEKENDAKEQKKKLQEQLQEKYKQELKHLELQNQKLKLQLEQEQQQLKLLQQQRQALQQQAVQLKHHYQDPMMMYTQSRAPPPPTPQSSFRLPFNQQMQQRPFLNRRSFLFSGDEDDAFFLSPAAAASLYVLEPQRPPRVSHDLRNLGVLDNPAPLHRPLSPMSSANTAEPEELQVCEIIQPKM